MEGRILICRARCVYTITSRAHATKKLCSIKYSMNYIIVLVNTSIVHFHTSPGWMDGPGHSSAERPYGKCTYADSRWRWRQFGGTGAPSITNYISKVCLFLHYALILTISTVTTILHLFLYFDLHSTALPSLCWQRRRANGCAEGAPPRRCGGKHGRQGTSLS